MNIKIMQRKPLGQHIYTVLLNLATKFRRDGDDSKVLRWTMSRGGSRDRLARWVGWLARGLNLADLMGSTGGLISATSFLGPSYSVGGQGG